MSVVTARASVISSEDRLGVFSRLGEKTAPDASLGPSFGGAPQAKTSRDMCSALAKHRMGKQRRSSQTVVPWPPQNATTPPQGTCTGGRLRPSAMGGFHRRLFPLHLGVRCISYFRTPQHPHAQRRDKKRTHPLRTTMKSMTFQPLRRYEPLWKMNPRATILIPASKQKIPMKYGSVFSYGMRSRVPVREDCAS